MRNEFVLKFFFDYRSGTCLWSADEHTREYFKSYPIAPEKFPLTKETVERIKYLAEQFDSSLNWEYPQDPGPWRQVQCDTFNQAVHKLFETLQTELGDRFEIQNMFSDVKEDPELDQYLKDPASFKRKK